MHLLTFTLHAGLLRFFPQFSKTLSLCPFSSSASLPVWQVPQLGLLVVREVEWTDNSTRDDLVVRNTRNVVVARPGKQGSHWCCGQGHLGSAGVVQGLACVGRALKWWKQQNTWEALFCWCFPVFWVWEQLMAVPVGIRSCCPEPWTLGLGYPFSGGICWS